MIPLGCNMYVVLKVQTFVWPGGSVGWSAALSRRRSRVRVSSGSLLIKINNNYILWDLSSAGRASALQAEGHRFEPYRSHMDGFPSGQRGQTVNLLAMPSKVRILLHPFDEYNSSVVASGYVPMWLNWQSS